MAEAFVRTAYDELQSDKLNVSIILTPLTSGNSIPWNSLPDIVINFDTRNERGELKSPTAKSILRVRLRVATDGTILSSNSSGDFVRTGDLENIVRFALAHPAWTDAELVKELARKGASYPGDSEKFSASLRLEQFEPYIGRIVSRRVAFDVRTPRARPELADAFSFQWVVELETEASPGERARVILRFEPFSGRLLSLSRSRVR